MRICWAALLCALLAVYAPSWGATVGSVPGTFNVSLSGTATYTIPISVPKGTAGTSPALALSYNSQSRGSSLGAGWSLSGLSVITRGPKTKSVDGFVAPISLGPDDALYLDGERLVPIQTTGSGAQTRTEYRKRNDDVTRIIRSGGDLNGAVFLVNTKGGLTLRFDGAGGSRIKTADGSTLVWAISRIADSAGNYIEFNYRANGQGDYDIASIRYTGHEVRAADGSITQDVLPYAELTFDYEKTSLVSEVYVSGQVIRKDSRLTGIRARIAKSSANLAAGQADLFARYVLTYADTTSANRFVLKKVQNILADGQETAATVFDYADKIPSWEDAPYQLPIAALAGGEKLSTAYHVGKFSASGSSSDILFGARVEGKLQSFAFRNQNGIWTATPEFSPPFAFVAADGTDLGALALDVNGDGRIDLLQHNITTDGSSEKSAKLSGDTGWIDSPGYTLPFAIANSGKRNVSFRYGNFTSKSLPDVLVEDGGLRRYLSNIGSGWQETDSLRYPAQMDGGAVVMDANCDGLMEVLDRSGPGGPVVLRGIRSSVWTDLAPVGFPASRIAAAGLNAVLQIDLDGDGCKDVLISNAQNAIREAYLVTTANWTRRQQFDPPFAVVDMAGAARGTRATDINGDGKEDVVARSAPDDADAFAYENDGSGWKKLGGEFVPPILGSAPGAWGNDLVWFTDINGDKREDVIAPSNGGATFGSVFLSTATGYQMAPEYSPSIPFARRDQQDRGVRFVDLNSDGLPDVVYRRDGTKDGKAEVVSGALLNTGAGWTDAPGLVPPKPLAGDDISGNPAQFVDVNGDGYVDMLYSYSRKDGALDRAYFTNELVDGHRAWVEQAGSALAPPAGIPFAQYGIGDLGVRILDLNSDGRPDILAGNIHTTPPFAAIPPVSVCTQNNGSSVCQLNRAPFATSAYLNDGSKWAPSPSLAPPLPFVVVPWNNTSSTATFVQTVDVNGDGQLDLVAKFLHPFDGSTVVSEIWLASNGKWEEAEFKVPIALDEPLRDQRRVIQWSDLNGDGLSDIVSTKRAGSVNHSETWLSTGRGFKRSQAWDIPLGAIVDRGGDPTFRLIDMNGDGYLDVFYSRLEAGTNSRGVYLNGGTGWTMAPQTPTTVPAFADEQGVDQGLRLVDVDGNGLPDAVRSFATNDQLVERAVVLNTGERLDTLTRIAAGYGVETRIIYRSITAPGTSSSIPRGRAFVGSPVYVPGSGSVYPYISAVPAAYIVARTGISDGSARIRYVSFRYGDLRTNAEFSEPLGFRWRESYQEDSGLLVRTENTQDRLIGNRVRLESTCSIRQSTTPGNPVAENYCPTGQSANPNSIKLSESENEWHAREQVLPSSIRLRQVVLRRSTTTRNDLQGRFSSKELTELKYDEPTDLLDRRLNVERVDVRRSDGTAVKIENEYGQDDPERWFFGRLTRAVVTKVGDIASGGGTERWSETVETRHSYDPLTGLLTSDISRANSPSAVTNTFKRDRFGNTVRLTTSAAGVPSRSSETEYDDLGRFVIKETDPMGFSSRTVRQLGSGSVMSFFDANGREASYKYDGLNRVVWARRPDGSQKSTKYVELSELPDPSAAVGVNAAYAVIQTESGRSGSIQIFDASGRLVRTVTEGFTKDENASRVIYTDILHDVYGLVHRSSLPYEKGKPVQWSTIEHDVLGRVTKTVGFDGSISRIKYAATAGGGSRVVSVDPRGYETTTVYNQRGLAVSISDPAGATTSNEYDASDRLVVVKDTLGRALRTDFGPTGNPIRVVDPNQGESLYEYDSLGQMIRSEDAKHQITTFEYDRIGRIVRKIEGTATSEWTYDTAANGVGKVHRIKRSDGYAEEYFYDQNGRSSATVISIAGEQFTSRYTYDTVGRLGRTYFPANNGIQPFVIDRRYDKKGFLVSVSSADGTTSYWKKVAADELGRTTVSSLGNDVTSQDSINKLTGAIDRRSVVSNGQQLLDLRLEYDPVGNLHARRENVGSRKDTFGYDKADRLTSWIQNGSASRASYDASNRLTFLTGPGVYEYASSSGSGPYHAPQATKTGGVRQQLIYDPNGNLVRNADAGLEYSADNRLSYAYASQARWVRFDYSPSGARYRQVAQEGPQKIETVYLPNFERVTQFISLGNDPFPRNRITRHRYYIDSPDGVVAVAETNVVYAALDAAPTVPTVTTNKVWYVHKDQLGSILAISDEAGKVAARFWYDPWGKRVATINDSASAPPGHRLEKSWVRGFTSHESILNDTFVHMNGRVYDPRLALFTTPDPLSSSFSRGLSLGAYNYASLNPLRYTDPTGYWSLGGAIGGAIIGFVTGGPAGAFAGALIGGNDDTRKWVEENWRTVATVAIAVGVTIATGGAGAGLAGAILSGMAVGASTGAAAALLYGGSFEDVLAAAVRGAAIGAFSGAAFYGVGSAFDGSATALGAPDSLGAVASHGAVGGAVEEAQDGDFWRGFAAAAFTKGSSVYGPQFASTAENITRAAVVGGTVAVISGGKFANGALIGAFSYAFNDLVHEQTPAASGMHRRVVIRDANGEIVDGFSFGMNGDEGNPFFDNFSKSGVQPGVKGVGNGIVYTDMVDPATKMLQTFRTSAAEDAAISRYIASRLGQTGPYNAFTNSCRTFSGTEYGKIQQEVIQSRSEGRLPFAQKTEGSQILNLH